MIRSRRVDLWLRECSACRGKVLLYCMQLDYSGRHTAMYTHGWPALPHACACIHHMLLTDMLLLILSSHPKMHQS
jgi:hypothetical protein